MKVTDKRSNSAVVVAAAAVAAAQTAVTRNFRFRRGYTRFRVTNPHTEATCKCACIVQYNFDFRTRVSPEKGNFTEKNFSNHSFNIDGKFL